MMKDTIFAFTCAFLHLLFIALPMVGFAGNAEEDGMSSQTDGKVETAAFCATVSVLYDRAAAKAVTYHRVGDYLPCKEANVNYVTDGVPLKRWQRVRCAGPIKKQFRHDFEKEIKPGRVPAPLVGLDYEATAKFCRVDLSPLGSPNPPR